MSISFPLGLSRTVTGKQPALGCAGPLSEGNAYRLAHAAFITLVHFDGNV